MCPRKLSLESYRVGWICPLEVEQIAAMEMLDEEHEPLPQSAADHNVYKLGSINGHNVVIAGLHQTGNCPAATVITQMRMTFQNLRFGLLVGIGGGVPVETDNGMIRLGHVVVSKPSGGHSGAVQYDHGKAREGRFERIGVLAPPPATLLSAAQAVAVEQARNDDDPIWKNTLRFNTKRRGLRRFKFPGIASDHLYQPDYTHQQNRMSCKEAGCNPEYRIEPLEDEDGPFIVVHRGNVASGELVIKDAKLRDRLARQYGILCFEMEAAGVLTDFPCMVIRGVSDYCDSHKNDIWHGFAAAAAAAYARQLFFHMPIEALQQNFVDLQTRTESLSIQSVENVSIAQKSHFLMPFPQDPDFVDRPGIMAWVKEQYSGSARRIALVGLGGFGKSQIAIEFAHRTHIDSPQTSVFWVHGGTEARFKESYQSLADSLALPRRHEKDVNILALTRDWLQKEDLHPWLIILDNVDDADTLFLGNQNNDPGREPLASYLPKSGNGKILITSRNLNVAEKLTGSHKLIREIQTMNESEALQILKNKLDGSESMDETAAADLVRAVDFIPLAVNQAAAYINRRAPLSVSIRSYIDKFQQSAKEKRSLLNCDSGDIRRHESVSNSVMVTWQVTFQQVHQERPTAANLLSLMSFFHPQNIPHFMLSGYGAPGDTKDSDSHDEEDLESDLDVLRAYSLINLPSLSGFYEMHSLVQFFTQTWILNFESPSFPQLKSRFLCLCAREFPDGSFETWFKCQILLPHIERLFDEEPAEETDALDWSSLLTKVSVYTRETGDYSRAKDTAQKAIGVRQKMLGEEHLDTLSSIANLAASYCDQGQWAEAESLEVQVMDIRKRILGEEHPDTLSSIGSLASTYHAQGRWAEAESLEVQVMDMRKRILGEEHPDTLLSIGNLASTYHTQGRWAKAESLKVQVMDMRKRILGEEHPDTLSSIGSLASTYHAQGRWAEAESLEVQVMDMRKRILGEEHPDTLWSIGNLASTYYNQGRWAEAESLHMQVMDIRKRILGEEHPDTLWSIGSLASTYHNQGRWAEAESLEVQVMDIRKRILGEEHPDTLSSIGNLASTYYAQGRWAEAESLEVQVMDMRKRILGEEHPDTLSSIGSLASTYHNQGRWAEAESLKVQVMDMRKRILGEEHPDTLSSIGSLASTYHTQGRWAEAESLKVQVMDMRKRILGEEHPDTLSSIGSLASTYHTQGRWAEAESLEVQVMDMRKRILGEEHPDTLSSIGSLASTYYTQGRWAEAESLEVQVMDMRKRILGEEHPYTLSSMNNMAITSWSRGRYVEALDLMRDCVSRLSRVLGPEHPHTLASAETLESWEQDGEEYTSA